MRLTTLSHASTVVSLLLSLFSNCFLTMLPTRLIMDACTLRMHYYSWPITFSHRISLEYVNHAIHFPMGNLCGILCKEIYKLDSTILV